MPAAYSRRLESTIDLSADNAGIVGTTSVSDLLLPVSISLR